MSKAAKKPAAHNYLSGEYAANDNHAPRPRLVVNNIQTSAHQKNKQSHIVARRAEKLNTQNSPQERGEQEPSKNTKRTRNALRYRPILRNAHNKKATKLTRVKGLYKSFMAFGIALYPMILQTIFAILMVVSLAVEDSWWGWVVPGITMAGIMFLLALLMGTYTMIISAFIFAKDLKNFKVMVTFMFCFSANWVPFVQIIPWTGVWIAYVTLKK